MTVTAFGEQAEQWAHSVKDVVVLRGAKVNVYEGTYSVKLSTAILIFDNDISPEYKQ